MKRSTLKLAPALCAALLLGVLPGLRPVAFAQDATKVREIGEMEVKALLEAASKETDPQKQAELYRQAFERQQAVEGAVGGINSVTAEMEAASAANERDREMYDTPGFWDKLGDKAIDIAGSLIGQLLQEWIAGGGKDDALLDQINDLQGERDRLINERENPAPGESGDPGLGRIITDSTGAHGYDRDGDGFVDIPVSPDGSMGPYNPTDDSGYGSGAGGAAGGSGGSGSGVGGMIGDGSGGAIGGLGDSIVTDSTGARGFDLDGDGKVDVPLKDAGESSPLAGIGGGAGGASMGNGNGMGFGGFGGGGAANPEAAAKAAEEAAAGLPGAAGGGAADLASASGSKNGKDGKSGATNEDGSPAVDDERKLETVIGRIMILPKLEIDELAGNRKKASEWGSNQDWGDSWGEDEWDDSRDNGDWGKKPKAEGAEGAEGEDAAKKAAELVDSIIRVETVIAEWREAEEKKATEGTDPYGFEDSYSGYQAPGSKKDDPFKDVRDEEGKIDLTKVDLWMVGRDTWKDGKEPIRYRVKLSPDVKTLEPTHGGVLVARGVLGEVEVEKRVLDEIKGKVQEIEIVQVILSAEKPPEDLSTLDLLAAEPTDSSVGGLESETPAAPSAPGRSEDGWGSPKKADDGWGSPKPKADSGAKKNDGWGSGDSADGWGDDW